MFFLRIITVLLILFPQSSFAYSCDDIPVHSGNNIELESFLRNQQSKFFSYESSQEEECMDKKELERISRGTMQEIKDFLGSVADFYDNACKKRDTEKIREQLKAMDLVLEEKQCVSLNQYQVYRDTYLLFKEFQQENSDNRFYDKDLYGANSEVCPLEANQDLRKAWCNLRTKLKNLNTKEETMSIDERERAKTQKEKELKQEAEVRAREYLRSNLDLRFFKILPSLSKETSERIMQKSQEDINQELNRTRSLINSPQSNNLQEALLKRERLLKTSPRLEDVNDLVTNIAQNYGKSYAVSVSLESEIRRFKKSAEKMLDKSQYNLRDLLYTLKKTESMGSQYSCSVNLN